MRYILAVILTLCSGMASASAIQSYEEARNLADRMVDLFLEKKFSEGLSLAKEHWPLPEVEIDSLANQVATQWPIVDQRFGKPTGVEFVREERIGSSFLRYYHLHKFTNHAIYWQITFYKPTDTWKVNSVTFLDNLNVLFDAVSPDGGRK